MKRSIPDVVKAAAILMSHDDDSYEKNLAILLKKPETNEKSVLMKFEDCSKQVSIGYKFPEASPKRALHPDIETITAIGKKYITTASGKKYDISTGMQATSKTKRAPCSNMEAYLKSLVESLGKLSKEDCEVIIAKIADKQKNLKQLIEPQQESLLAGQVREFFSKYNLVVKSHETFVRVTNSSGLEAATITDDGKTIKVTINLKNKNQIFGKFLIPTLVKKFDLLKEEIMDMALDH